MPIQERVSYAIVLEFLERRWFKAKNLVFGKTTTDDLSIDLSIRSRR